MPKKGVPPVEEDVATYASTVARTGVAQGDAMSALVPPRRKVLNRRDDVDVVEMEDETTAAGGGNIFPSSSNCISLNSEESSPMLLLLPSLVVSFSHGRLNSKEGRGKSSMSNNLSPIMRLIADPSNLSTGESSSPNPPPNTPQKKVAESPSIQNTDASPAAKAKEGNRTSDLSTSNSSEFSDKFS